MKEPLTAQTFPSSSLQVGQSGCTHSRTLYPLPPSRHACGDAESDQVKRRCPGAVAASEAEAGTQQGIEGSLARSGREAACRREAQDGDGRTWIQCLCLAKAQCTFASPIFSLPPIHAWSPCLDGSQRQMKHILIFFSHMTYLFSIQTEN